MQRSHAIGCRENYRHHYCKICNNNISDHLSSLCPTLQKYKKNDTYHEYFIYPQTFNKEFKRDNHHQNFNQKPNNRIRESLI